VLSCTYACLYTLAIWNVKLYDYSELILIFYRPVTFKNLLNTYPSHYYTIDQILFISKNENVIRGFNESNILEILENNGRLDIIHIT